MRRHLAAGGLRLCVDLADGVRLLPRNVRAVADASPDLWHNVQATVLPETTNRRGLALFWKRTFLSCLADGLTPGIAAGVAWRPVSLRNGIPALICGMSVDETSWSDKPESKTNGCLIPRISAVLNMAWLNIAVIG